jgi:hypothetical protein
VPCLAIDQPVEANYYVIKSLCHRSFCITVELHRRLVEAEPKVREWNIFKKREQHAIIEIGGFRRRTLKFGPDELGLARRPRPEGNHVAAVEPIFKGVGDFLSLITPAWRFWTSNHKLKYRSPLRKSATSRTRGWSWR